MTESGDDVVISGMSGMFPNSDNIRHFEENLWSKVDMTSDDNRRWTSDNINTPKRLGKLNEINKFDATFFNILPNTADMMDPMGRILLEKTYEAIVDAGYNVEEIKGSKTAVIVGVTSSDTILANFSDPEYRSFRNVVVTLGTLLANRISFWLDARGPSYIIDTACSSSMYAFEHAYKAIKSGECDSAIVGGSNICLHKKITQGFLNFGLINREGKCKCFDESADGYVRAETVAVLFLQKRKDARRVFSKVVHAKTSCDGYTEEGIHYPSETEQTNLLKGFYEECKVNPRELQFLEAHATGTRVGDPVEMKAVEAAILTNREKPLKIGSVKSNMGHAEVASGICSIVKVILSYECGFILPNINLKELRKEISALQTGKLVVVTDPTPWDGGFCGINSFGFGGANCHILLDSNHKTKVNKGLPDDDISRLVCISGRTEEAVDVILTDLESRPLDVEYVALFHEIHKEHIPGHTYRGYTILQKQHQETIRHIKVFSEEEKPVWFVYPGIGSQWNTMGESLMRIPIINESIQKCHRILSTKGVDLIKILVDKDPTIFDNILNSYCGIIAIEIALTDFLRAICIEPAGIIGHSVGEFACAYADGSLTLEQTILLAYYRGEAFFESTLVPGSMAAVGMGTKEIKSILPPSVDIACHNGPNNCTISGLKKDIDSFVKELQKRDVFVRKVESSNAALHSRYVSGVGQRFQDKTKDMLSKAVRRSEKWFSSTFTENEWNSEEAQYASAEYFAKNIVSPVYFEGVCNHVPKNAIVIEVGPHGLLQAILKRSLNKDVINIQLTNKGHLDNALHLLTAVGEIYEAGVNPKISKIYPSVQFPVSRSTPSISSLVRWDHGKDWFVYEDEETSRITKGQRTALVEPTENEHKYLNGHIIRGKNLYPAAGYLVLAWETFSLMNGKPMNKTPVMLTDVQFKRFTSISGKASITFNVSIYKNSGDFEISEQGELVTKGKIFALPENFDEQPSNMHDCEDDGELLMSEDDFYHISEVNGFGFTGLFRSVKRTNYEKTKARIAWHNNYVSFIDCVLQMLGSIHPERQTGIHIPISLKTVIIDPGKHEQILKTCDPENPELFSVASLEPYEIHCGGITLANFETTPTSFGKSNQICIMEKIEFVSYMHPKLSILDEAVRVCTQIIIENINDYEVKIIEILTNGSISDSFISPQIYKTVADIPLVKVHITIQTDEESLPIANEFEECFQVQTCALENDESCTLIIALGAQEDKKNLSDYLKSLQTEGFILTRKNMIDSLLIEQLDLVIYFEYELDNHSLILLRKKCRVNYEILAVKISNNFNEWVPALQETFSKLSADKKVVLFAEKDPRNGILGLYNAISKENPHQNICCFFMMDEDTPPFDVENAFYKNQLEKNLRVNVFKNGAWGSYRHLPLSDTKTTRSDHKYVNLLSYGDLSTLQWFEGPLNPKIYVPTGENKSLISVHYASLNFRDVMIATGRMDPLSVFKNRSEQECMIGMEFAGCLSDGRRVMGIVNSGAITNYLECDSKHMWPIPDEWSLEQAVTVPVVYTTVLYAFFSGAPFKRGSSILIHCGAGGVGIAAINLCLHYGCEIFTTVGSEEKRKFIRSYFPSIPDDHIGNSRNCSFERMVKRATDGVGVDLVLNSLAGDKLEASIRCVKSGGRFIEIGKYDMIMNNSLDMKPFLKGMMFHTVDLTKIMYNDETCNEVQTMMINALKDGIIKPLPATCFSADEAEKAFRFLAAGKHIGKVVLKLREDNSPLEQLPPMNCYPQFSCNPHKLYILCGGLGGLGITLTNWLVVRGARKLILTSRRGVTRGIQHYWIRKWQQKGISVTVSTGDISEKPYVRHLLELANSIAPVAAIFNLAAVLLDKMFENQRPEDFERSSLPKAAGTSHLDELSRELCPQLDHFVVYSSVSSVLGAVGQTNYAISNSIMERICELRKADNLPALGIAFGPVADVGIFAKTLKQLRETRAHAAGADPSTEHEDMPAVGQLESVNFSLLGGFHQQSLESYLAVHDRFLRQPAALVLSMVVSEKSLSIGKSRSLSETIALILGIPRVESVRPEATLSQLGMDSMTNAEIREVLRREWDIVFTLRDVANLTFSQIKRMDEKCAKKHVSKYGTEDEPSEISIADSAYQYVINCMKSDLSDVQLVVQLPANATIWSGERLPKIFICPGTDGLAHSHVDFGRKLGGQVYIFQYRYVNALHTVADIAQSLVAEAEKILSANEPFHIIGISFGVLVALDLVQLLEKNGRNGRLWMMDSDVSVINSIRQNIFENGIQKVVSTAINGWKEQIEQIGQNASNEPELSKFIHLTIKEEGRNLIKETLDVNPEWETPLFFAVWIVRFKALIMYVHPPKNSVKVKATLIRAVDMVTNEPYDSDISQYFQEPVQIHYVKANHFTVTHKKETIDIIKNELKNSWEEYLRRI